jgi:hypothetical protein
VSESIIFGTPGNKNGQIICPFFLLETFVARKGKESNGCIFQIKETENVASYAPVFDES